MVKEPYTLKAAEVGPVIVQHVQPASLHLWPFSKKINFIPHPVFSSQSAGSVDLTGILLASHRATLHDFMALSYGPAGALAFDRRRGFRAWVGCDDRYRKNFCLVRCNAHKRVQALPTMPLHDVNTVDAPLQERVKSRKNYIALI